MTQHKKETHKKWIAKKNVTSSSFAIHVVQHSTGFHRAQACKDKLEMQHFGLFLCGHSVLVIIVIYHKLNVCTTTKSPDLHTV